MKSFRYILRQTILSIIASSGLYNLYRRKNRDRVLVMVYHDVVDDQFDIPSNHYNYNTTIRKSRFVREVKYLCRHYTPITLEDFIAWKIKGEKLPPNPVLFTFDDGHTNLFRNAVPELNKRGIKAVFFVKSGCMGTIEQNYCERYLSYTVSYKEGQKAYTSFRQAPFAQQEAMIDQCMGKQYDPVNPQKYSHITQEECRALLKEGHSIQSHTVHHYILSSLEDSAVRDELVKSKQDLEQLFSLRVEALAYPFGDPRFDFGEREKIQAKNAGYLLAFSGERRDVNGVTRDEDNFSISRFGDVNHDFLYFKLLLSPIRLVK